jgi:DMSO reductase family type II enzyme molybdopterin subunit
VRNGTGNTTQGSSGFDRRNFLKGAGGAGFTLSLLHLGPAISPSWAQEVANGESVLEYSSWEDLYRDEWTWDKVTWGSHTNQCAPGGCSFRVYTRNGVVWREEQSARSYASNADYPDFNPQGCQKGCGFHNTLTNPDRVKYPLRRVGERGEGRWERVSWDEALTDIADSILDAHETHGTESVVIDSPHIHAGNVALAGISRFASHLNAITIDLNVGIGDDFKGIGQTFGKMNFGYTADNFFDAELIILTHSNVSYTWPAVYHFVTEARYNGTEVIVIAPDYNATALTADIHLPVKVASDAALWMSVCQVMIEEDLHQKDFLREQTDMAILVRKDNGHYLRASDIAEGSKEQFYFWDEKEDELREAPRGTLKYKGSQALEGTWNIALADGTHVEVSPTYALLKEKLNKEYTPEQATETCGIHPDVIRSLARKVAAKRTCSYIGFTSAKHYHGDLMERSMLLAMALSGNWGKPGTGFHCFLVPDVGLGMTSAISKPLKRTDMLKFGLGMALDYRKERKKTEGLTKEIYTLEKTIAGTKRHGTVPPVFFMYNHAGYDKLWDNPDWQDPSLDKTFGEYLHASIDQKFFDDANAKPGPEQVPQVMLFMANNPLRRQRSGRRMYVEDLFPKVKMLFALEPRMSSTAQFCDIVLPAAWYYEKDDMTMTFALNPYTALIEKAVEPPGEAKPEWEIFSLLMKKISDRAVARGMTSFVNRGGDEHFYEDLFESFTMQGHYASQLDVLKEMVKIAGLIGTFPKGMTYEKMQKMGQVRVEAHGGGKGTSSAADFETDKPFYSFSWHTDKKQVYPTASRRAQFYIEHDWFLEAGEAFPTHKDTPPIGGIHPFQIVSGHVRGSIHSMHTSTPDFMRLHRGEPIIFINDKIAKERGINDADKVKMFNDFDEAEIMACVSPSVGPDEVVIYMWENFQFKDWKSHDAMLIGMPKSIQMANDYTQLRYRSMQGSPSPSNDRGLRVDIVKVGG